jgi:hypothetical protein
MTQQRDEAARDAELREAARISALVSDLNRIGRLLGADIAREENEAGITNLSNAAYPIAARILRVRRDNLANTIVALEKRLASVLERSQATDNWTPAPHLTSKARRNDRHTSQ